MDQHETISSQISGQEEEELEEEEEMDDLRRGPWTAEEDVTLMNYIARHGEGRWTSLARSSGLKRNGKSCRLRWLNYLRPDVRRGNITLEEQLLILELHSRWGNRWSKIAQHLPGRTDNEIKNYWRTRVQKHAKQLKCDANSKEFKDTMRYLWMPKLVERIQASSSNTTRPYNLTNQNITNIEMGMDNFVSQPNISNYTAKNSSNTASSESFNTPDLDLTEGYNNHSVNYYPGNNQAVNNYYGEQGLSSTSCYLNQGMESKMDMKSQWMDGGDASDGLWNVDDVWFLQQPQFNNNV